MKGTRRIACMYFNSIPSPYVVGRFNALADAVGRDEFLAVFEQVREPDREWLVAPADWRFSYILLPPTNRRRYLALARILVTRRPRVVITLYHSWIYLFCALVARLLGSRVVFRVLKTHETWITRRRHRELVKRLAFRLLANGCKTSGADGEAYARTYGGPGFRAWHVTQGIDLEKFRPKQAPRRSPLPSRRFIYVGRMIAEKDVEGLVTAFTALLASGRHAELHMVGTGPEADRLAPRSASSVVWHGHVEGAALTQLYQDSEVFVFPTLGDPYGLALTEAMACGCAVITSTAIGELQDRVVEPQTGLVVPPADVAALTRAMARYCDFPDLLAIHQHNALAHAQGQHYAAYAHDVVLLLRDLKVSV